MMYQRNIRLSQESVGEFVNAASKCEFDIDVCYGRITVDAKSIMGVFSLDLSHCLTVKYQGQDDNFGCVLNRYEVA